jgi:aspartate aminotransferase
MGSETAFNLNNQTDVHLNEKKIPQLNLTIGAPYRSPFDSSLVQNILSYPSINDYAPAFGVEKLKENILSYYQNKNPFCSQISFQSHNILITHGAIGALDLIIRHHLMAENNIEVILPELGFPPYYSLVKENKGVIKTYKLNASLKEPFVHWEHLRSLITNKTRLILFNSPHNPTGRVMTSFDRRELMSILNDFPQVEFILDEVYREFIYTNEPHLDLMDLLSRGYIVHSASKMFPLPGARVGWVISTEKKINDLKPLLSQCFGPVSSFGQFIVSEYFQHYLIPDVSQLYVEAEKKSRGILKAWCVPMENTQGSFYHFLKSPTEDFMERLAEKGVNVLPGHLFGTSESYGKTFRASFATTDENIVNGFNLIGECYAYSLRGH